MASPRGAERGPAIPFADSTSVLKRDGHPDPSAPDYASMAHFLLRSRHMLAAQGTIVSGTLLPPCKARFEPQDANRLWHIGSHIWSTI
jgi:hypothetical protein